MSARGVMTDDEFRRSFLDRFSLQEMCRQPGLCTRQAVKFTKDHLIHSRSRLLTARCQKGGAIL